MHRFTIKQQRFIDFYDGNATDAARKAGLELIELPPKMKYYIYALVDSLKNEIFYVGKGTGNRMFSHVTEWVNGHVENAGKFERIREIFKNQGTVKYLLLHETENEVEAYNIEKAFINAIGRNDLTNIMDGREPESEKNRVKAIDLLSRLRPNDGYRGKHYPGLRKFLIEIVVSFGYKVDENDNQIKIFDKEATQVC